ncbi:PilZ domain-containing protein [Aquisalimonas asiatica]|uniref:Cyclic diguanosine monophosphate-binding protein n=1 Tax=Aquisalimonas asiatica TaxID=406100 RepID=A0A1H8QZG0_9GAMM|nr:PilZ domain-containing protein [Aquisalimonas asiatica]SEO59258.1 PilZ domain-containing protein [Aquisalimonas asiatica]
MAPSTERRQFSRIQFDSPARLNTAADTLDVRIVDISLKGVLVLLPETGTVSDAEQCRLDIPLTDELHIEMTLEAAHRRDQRVGFHCTHIDIESMGHLRRLVELNLGDADILRRELAEMADEGHASS